MKTLILICFLCTVVFAYSSNVINAYAVSIMDEQFNEENVQAKRKSDKDYNGVCYSKIYIFGNYFHEKPSVRIGNSIGHIYKEKIITKNGYNIGKEIIFKHYTVTKGYFQVRFGNKLYDSKVFIK
jgi:hypothetical protein